jgi:hypothetical protein
VSRVLQEEEIISGERIRWIAEECDRNGVSAPGDEDRNDAGGMA